jgi:hypothetical protein
MDSSTVKIKKKKPYNAKRQEAINRFNAMLDRLEAEGLFVGEVSCNCIINSGGVRKAKIKVDEWL